MRATPRGIAPSSLRVGGMSWSRLGTSARSPPEARAPLCSAPVRGSPNGCDACTVCCRNCCPWCLRRWPQLDTCVLAPVDTASTSRTSAIVPAGPIRRSTATRRPVRCSAVWPNAASTWRPSRQRSMSGSSATRVGSIRSLAAHPRRTGCTSRSAGTLSSSRAHGISSQRWRFACPNGSGAS